MGGQQNPGLSLLGHQWPVATVGPSFPEGSREVQASVSVASPRGKEPGLWESSRSMSGAEKSYRSLLTNWRLQRSLGGTAGKVK